MARSLFYGLRKGQIRFFLKDMINLMPVKRNIASFPTDRANNIILDDKEAKSVSIIRASLCNYNAWDNCLGDLKTRVNEFIRND